jgi:branched-chain amino acid transport system permease protein
MLYGVILVAMMLFRPEGLIPSRQRRAEFREANSIRRCWPRAR